MVTCTVMKERERSEKSGSLKQLLFRMTKEGKEANKTERNAREENDHNKINVGKSIEEGGERSELQLQREFLPSRST